MKSIYEFIIFLPFTIVGYIYFVATYGFKIGIALAKYFHMEKK